MSLFTPDEFPPDPAAPRQPRSYPAATFIAWSVIIAIALLTIVGTILEQQSPTEEADPFDAGGMSEILAAQDKITVTARPINAYEQARVLPRPNIRDKQRLAIIAYELVGIDKANEVLDDIDERLAELEEVEEQAAAAQEALRTLYATDPTDAETETAPAAPQQSNVAALTTEQQATLKDRFGWFGELALVPDDGTQATEDARDALFSGPWNVVIVFTIVVVLAGGAALLGLVGLIVMAVIALTNRLRAYFHDGRHYHGIYAETFALWMVSFIILQIVMAPIAMNTPDIAFLIMFFAFMLSLIVLIWPVVRGVPWKQVCDDIGWTTGRNVFAEIGLAFCGYIMALPLLAIGVILTLILVTVQSAIMGYSPEEEAANMPSHPIIDAFAGGDIGIYLQLLLVAAVAAPIVEETFFRGVLYRHLRDATHRTYIISILFAVLVNAFIFAAIHPQGLVGIPPLMALAISFSLMREWRSSLIASIGMHAINNGLIVTLVFLFLTAMQSP